MDVPDEVLITSMRSHQKYFSLLKENGRLANRFLVVSNMETVDDGREIISGNQRVLRARLSDAKFFWDTDRKHRLDSRLPKLAERLYYAKLGTMEDKVRRVTVLARHIAAATGADAAPRRTGRPFGEGRSVLGNGRGIPGTAGRHGALLRRQ